MKLKILVLKCDNLSRYFSDSCVEIIKSLSHNFTIVSNRDSDANKALSKPDAKIISNIK